jgi:prepilin-type N-terminal cleavage/methylation domain-containing protein
MTNFSRDLFDIRHSSFSVRRAFTLIELLVVIAIIIVLAGLVLSTIGYVQKKGARSRAETEIAAISAACESYKADNGIYPRGSADLSNTTPYDTDNLNARTNGDPATTTYQKASLYLYKVLSGDLNANRQIDAGETGKSYFAFKPNMLLPAPPSLADVTAIRDPFGNSYGYSTAYQYDVDQGNAPTHGYNPTFDLWSTAGLTTDPPTVAITQQWIKNW